MDPALHIPLMIELHAEEAAILWLKRNDAVNAPHFNLTFLARLDERLEAQIDGLRVADKAGWDVVSDAFEAAPEPGEAFTLAAVAFSTGDKSQIGNVLDILDATPDLLRPMISAMGWLRPQELRGKVAGLLDDPRPLIRRLGIGACSAHRVDPGERLTTFLRDEPEIAAQTARLAGELGREDLTAEMASLAGSDPAGAFWSAWAEVLLGDRFEALERLKSIANIPGPYRWQAFELAQWAMENGAARDWLGDFRNDPDRSLFLIKSAGILGEPKLVPWLISQMENPALARRAGESFSLITGADLEYLDLDGEEPDEADTGPNDDPADPNVTLDPDDDLPWPDPARIEEWWQNQSADFAADQQYFLGLLSGTDAFQRGLCDGFQRQRRAAAYGRALQSPQSGLFNWRMQAKSQADALGIRLTEWKD